MHRRLRKPPAFARSEILSSPDDRVSLWPSNELHRRRRPECNLATSQNRGPCRLGGSAERHTFREEEIEQRLIVDLPGDPDKPATRRSLVSPVEHSRAAISLAPGKTPG